MHYTHVNLHFFMITKNNKFIIIIIIIVIIKVNLNIFHNFTISNVYSFT